MYEYDVTADGSWNQLGDDIDGEADYDKAGKSVSMITDVTILAIRA